MHESRNGKNLSDTGLQSFKIDKRLQVAALVVSLLAISLYDRLMALRPWSWLARGGPSTGVIMGFTAVHLVVFFAMGYLLFSWMKRRTASSTLTLSGLILVLFVKYPVIQNGPLAFFLGPSDPMSHITPSLWYWIGYYLGLYAGFGFTIGLALWVNYLVYRIARRHGVQAAMAVAVGIWGFHFGPICHGASLPQTVVLCLAVLSLAVLAWWPSAAALKTFAGLVAVSFLVGIITGGLSSPTFTAFGLRRVTLIPFLVLSTGVVGAALASALARRRPKGAQQIATT